MVSAFREGPTTSNLMGGIGLLFTLMLWATSQEVVRRRAYLVFKPLHHIGFWGFMLLGVAHHWVMFWVRGSCVVACVCGCVCVCVFVHAAHAAVCCRALPWWALGVMHVRCLARSALHAPPLLPVPVRAQVFVPGMLLYAVDGVFRLHQMFFTRAVDARTSTVAGGGGAAAAQRAARGASIIAATELLVAEADAARTMCSLLVSVPSGFGASPVGCAWINVPALSATQWHPFDCTGVRVAAADGSSGPRMALQFNIKAYDRCERVCLRVCVCVCVCHAVCVRA
jgi:hypothetical protein